MDILAVPAGSISSGSVAVTNVTGMGTGVQTALQQPATGTGSPVLSTSPTLTTPNLGTPSSVNLTNGTALPVGSGISGLGTGVVAALETAVTGSGSMVLNTSPALVTPALDTPSAGVLTNCTGLPVSTGIAGLGTGVATALGNAVTGSGSIVLGTAPTVTLGNATGLPISTGVSGLGTGVATALGQAVTGSGSVVLSTNAALTTPNLGTPSAVTLTNGTGLPVSTGLSGTGTGVKTALGASVTGSGGMVLATSPAITTPTIPGGITSINGVAAVGPGVPIIVADTGTTYANQTAVFGPSPIYAVPAGQGGRYRVSMTAVVTVPGGTSSTLPNSTIGGTDLDSSGAVNGNIGSTSTGNTTSTWAQGSIVLQAKGGTNITAQTVGYASAGTAMQYTARYFVEYLGA